MTIELSRPQLGFNRAVFDWCLRNARRAERIGHQIQSTRWCQLAAHVAGFGCGQLASAELERMILRLAKKIPSPERPTAPYSDKRRWLHVMTRTDSIGGHNALLQRWIESNPHAEQHSIVVIEREDPDETRLRAATARSGGGYHHLGDLTATPLECARKLRELAWREADVVVLHQHMWDILPALAFGLPDGPPVLILNMADHLFWVGASVADLVLQIRPEGTRLTRQFRGIDRNYLLNVPLAAKVPEQVAAPGRNVRERLGIGDEARVFLTIGRAPKYEPREGIDFLSVARQILEQAPDAYLIAVGPSPEHPAWKRAHDATRGRLIAVGTQRELRDYFAAADVYLEGFPFGSLTALLEAGFAGLPCVRAPAILPPIYRSNGPAIDHLPEPGNTDEYAKIALDLAALPKARLREIGADLAARVGQYHCGGWSRTLAVMPIPDAHKTYPPNEEPPALPLASAKLLRWYDGDVIAYARWMTGQQAVNTRIDARLLLNSLAAFPDFSFFLRLVRTFLHPPKHQPNIKGIT